MLLAALLAVVTSAAAPVRPAWPPGGAYQNTMFLDGASIGAGTALLVPAIVAATAGALLPTKAFPRSLPIQQHHLHGI